MFYGLAKDKDIQRREVLARGRARHRNRFSNDRNRFSNDSAPKMIDLPARAAINPPKPLRTGGPDDSRLTPAGLKHLDKFRNGGDQRLLRHNALRPCHLSGTGGEARCTAGGRGERRFLGETHQGMRKRMRMRMLAALECVDWVVPFSDNTPARLIGRVLPDKLVKGGDNGPANIPGGEFVQAAGGEVLVLDYVEDLSTNGIIRAIRSGDREKNSQ